MSGRILARGRLAALCFTSTQFVGPSSNELTAGRTARAGFWTVGERESQVEQEKDY